MVGAGFGVNMIWGRLFLYPGEYSFILRIRVDVDNDQDLFLLNLLNAIILILGCDMKKVSQLKLWLV